MCRLYEWLYALIPVRRVRARLLRSHLETCGRCRTKFEPAGLGAAAAPPDWIAAEESLWPAVRERIRATPLSQKLTPALEPARFGRRWKWAVPAAFAGMLLIAAAIFLFRPVLDPGDLPRVSIVRAESDGQKAKTFFYQTREASYVWVTGPEKKDGE
jgi:hypothetical protein